LAHNFKELLKSKLLIVILLILLALILRYNYRADKGLWIDEAKTALLSIGDGGGREMLQVIWYNFFGANSEPAIRLPVILASSLTVGAFYWVFGIKSLPFMVLIAIHPFFVHWGALGRPYALASFFCVLGIRQKWFYVPALLSTPFAVVGLYWFEKDRIVLNIGLIVIGIMWYSVMPLSESDHFNWGFLTHAKRLWYIPVVSLCCHLVGAYELQGIRNFFQRLDRITQA